MRLVYTSRFDREFIALLKSRRINHKRVEKILLMLKDNPHSPTLHLHKLTGTNNYAASID